MAFLSLTTVLITAALAEAPATAQAASVSQEVAAPAPAEGHPFIGVAADVGLPDGIGAGLVVTPLAFLRLEVSGLTNGLGAGARGGLQLMAFPSWPVRPFLAASGGYVWGGAWTWAGGLITDATLRAALTGVNLGFVDVDAGLELGSKHFAFVVRAGLAYVDAKLGPQAIDFGNGATATAAGTHLHGFIPSARVGLLLNF